MFRQTFLLAQTAVAVALKAADVPCCGTDGAGGAHGTACTACTTRR